MRKRKAEMDNLLDPEIAEAMEDVQDAWYNYQTYGTARFAIALYAALERYEALTEPEEDELADEGEGDWGV